MSKEVWIGGGSGFWGDTDEATAQLLTAPRLDFLIYDYLSEITLALLARARARDPNAGFVPDFLTALKPHLAALKQRGIRVISNAGALNPIMAANTLRAMATSQGIELRVAAITGDDVAEKLSGAHTDMLTGAPLPPHLLSANAYLGAAGIVAALEDGADIIITGRCADSALTLAPLVHAFGWKLGADWDKLAQGSLAGHLIECGPQVTGGLFTDWRDTHGWDNMGFPIAVCRGDGSFDITKPPGTGGVIAPLAVAEQLVYEIGDPASYLLPDVTCDFRNVRLESTSDARVRVSGAIGRPAPAAAKVCVTWQDGWRCAATFMIGGIDAAEKAQRTAEAILGRAERINAAHGLAPFTRSHIEVLGAETTYGPHARAQSPREVIVKLAAIHTDRAALDCLAKEIYPAATSMSPGITGAGGGRPKPTPLIRSGAIALGVQDLTITSHIGDTQIPVSLAPVSPALGPSLSQTAPLQPPAAPRRRLIDYAVARSGDKGDIVNIGVVARSDEAYAYLFHHLTIERVAAYLRHLGASRVERFELPGVRALNFVLHDALDGGGLASLRHDPQGKAVAQMLLDIDI